MRDCPSAMTSSPSEAISTVQGQTSGSRGPDRGGPQTGGATSSCDKNQSTKDNSDSGGCETLETPNIFLFPSVLSFITILIRSCFYFRKIYSPSQSRSYFI